MPPSNSQFWTDKRDAVLTACVEKGMSRSESAAAINAEFGTSYSRSAVSGRMDRLGLNARPSRQPARPGSPKGFFAHRLKRKARPPVAAAPRGPALAPAARVPLLRLKDHHCRAVLEERGADGLAVFCGATRMHDATSYCAAHHEAFHRRGTQ